MKVLIDDLELRTTSIHNYASHAIAEESITDRVWDVDSEFDLSELVQSETGCRIRHMSYQHVSNPNPINVSDKKAHTTRFIVSSTDRQRKRSIQADSPGEAVATFLGSRCATFRCTSSSFDKTEFWYGASVTAYTGEYRRSHPVKNIHVYVSEHH